MDRREWEVSVEGDVVLIRSGGEVGARVALGEVDIDRLLLDLEWYMELRPICPHGLNTARSDIFEARLAGLREYLCEQLAGLEAEAPTILSICVTQERLRRFPWEIVELPSLFVRRSPRSATPSAVWGHRAGAPLHVLIAAPRPAGIEFFDHRPSTLNIMLRARETGAAVVVEYLPMPNCRALRLRLEDLSKPTVDVLHIDGHGRWHSERKRSVIVFETEFGQRDEVDARRLAGLLPGGLSLLVLEVCSSGRVSHEYESEFVALNAPAILAFPWSVTHATTERFFQNFYAALFSGQTISGATAHARREMRASATQICAPHGARVGFEQRDWFVPVLYQRGGDRVLCPSNTQARTAPVPLRNFPRPRAEDLFQVERRLELERVAILSGIIGEGTRYIAQELAWWLVVTRRVDVVVVLEPQDMSLARFRVVLEESLSQTKNPDPRFLFVVLDLQAMAMLGVPQSPPGAVVIEELERRIADDPRSRLVVTSWDSHKLLEDLFHTLVHRVQPLTRVDAIVMIAGLTDSPPSIAHCELVAELLTYHQATIQALGPALLTELDAEPDGDPREILMRASWEPGPRLRAAIEVLMPQAMVAWAGDVLVDSSKLASLAVHEHQGLASAVLPLRRNDYESLHAAQRDILTLAHRGLAVPMFGAEDAISLSKETIEVPGSSGSVSEILFVPFRLHPGLAFYARTQLSSAQRYHASRWLIYWAAGSAASLTNLPKFGRTLDNERIEESMRDVYRPNMRRALWCTRYYRRTDHMAAIYLAVDLYTRRSGPSFEQGLTEERLWATQLLASRCSQLIAGPISEWQPGAPEALLTWADDQLRRGASVEAIACLEELVVALEHGIGQEPLAVRPLLSAISVLWMGYGMEGRFFDALERQDQALRLIDGIEASDPGYAVEMRAQCLACRAQLFRIIEAPTVLAATLVRLKRALEECPPSVQRSAIEAQYSSVTLRMGLEKRAPAQAFGSSRDIADDHMRMNVGLELGSALLAEALSKQSFQALHGAEYELTEALAGFIELGDRGSGGLSALGLAQLAGAEGRLVDSFFALAWARQELSTGGRNYERLRSLQLLAGQMLDSIDDIPPLQRDDALGTVREVLDEAVVCARGQQHPRASLPLRMLAEFNQRFGLPQLAQRQVAMADELDARWRVELEARTGVAEEVDTFAIN